MLFADDSFVARGQITRTLDALQVRHVGAINGRQAWQELEKFAAHAQATECRICDLIHAVLTDVEMPEMDGFVLTRRIKSDTRFADIPVIIHSSLSGAQNRHLAGVGADEYRIQIRAAATGGDSHACATASSTQGARP